MQSSFLFKTAVLTQARGATGPVFRLHRAMADLGGDEQSRFRLQVYGKASDATNADATGEDEVPLFTLELSEAEAFTFSEWLDAAVTSRPPE